MNTTICCVVEKLSNSETARMNKNDCNVTTANPHSLPSPLPVFDGNVPTVSDFPWRQLMTMKKRDARKVVPKAGE
jgi:hypothetical protein